MATIENEEEIQQQMMETRASLAEKLETLEQKVVGTVEEATTAVTETVDVIKDSVQGTVTAVNETVKESVETVKDWFDVSGHVRQHPWAALGGSVAAGYCLGTMLSKTPQQGQVASQGSYPLRMGYPGNGGVREEQSSSREAQAPAAPSALKTALRNWAPEIDKLKSLALGVLFGTAREMIVSSVSDNVGKQLEEIIDSVTRKVGGEPIPSSDWAKKSQQGPTHDGHHGERDEAEAQWQGQRAYGTTEGASRRW